MSPFTEPFNILFGSITLFWVIGLGGLWVRQSWIPLQRQQFLNGYSFSPALRDRLALAYPGLSLEQQELVLEVLKDYFRLCLQVNHALIAMPSRVVDAAWHEFILFTRDYEAFCRRTFGRFLHHSPSEGTVQSQKGIKLAWRLACRQEGIDPRSPNRLPRLFGIDAQLGIPEGFYYSLNGLQEDEAPNENHTIIYTNEIGCGGYSGSWGDSGHSGSDSSLHGHGCSGHGGCSGGCGGGGCGGG